MLHGSPSATKPNPPKATPMLRTRTKFSCPAAISGSDRGQEGSAPSEPRGDLGLATTAVNGPALALSFAHGLREIFRRLGFPACPSAIGTDPSATSWRVRHGHTGASAELGQAGRLSTFAPGLDEFIE